MCLFDYPPIELSAGSACKHQKKATELTTENHPPFNKPLLATTEGRKKEKKDAIH